MTPATPAAMALAGLLLITAGCRSATPQPAPTDGDPVAGEVAVAEPLQEEEDPKAPIAPLQRRSVSVYFPSAAGDSLLAELREIFETATPGDMVKQIVADLISGPSSNKALRALPPGTRLRQVYVLENGVAYLDFSRDLVDGIGGGSLEELLAIYSIVDSIALNIRGIDKVGILIQGEPIATLNGHVDLSRPLPPDSSWIEGTKTAGLDDADPRPPAAIVAATGATRAE